MNLETGRFREILVCAIAAMCAGYLVIHGEPRDYTGIRALGWIAAGSVAAFVFPKITKWTPLLVLMSGLWLAALRTACNGCFSYTAFDAVMSVLAFLVWILLLVSMRLKVIGVAWLLFCIPLAQMVMLAFDPKLCPGCIGIAVTCVWTATGLFGGEEFKAAQWKSTTVLSVVVASLMVETIVIGELRLFPTLAATTHEQPRIPAELSPLADGIYLISAPGCAPCDLAKKWIATHSAHVAEIPVCPVRTGRCWQNRQSLPTPTLLEVKDGAVKNYLFGFSESSYADFTGQ